MLGVSLTFRIVAQILLVTGFLLAPCTSLGIELEARIALDDIRVVAIYDPNTDEWRLPDSTVTPPSLLFPLGNPVSIGLPITGRIAELPVVTNQAIIDSLSSLRESLGRIEESVQGSPELYTDQPAVAFGVLTTRVDHLEKQLDAYRKEIADLRVASRWYVATMLGLVCGVLGLGFYGLKSRRGRPNQQRRTTTHKPQIEGGSPKTGEEA